MIIGERDVRIRQTSDDGIRYNRTLFWIMSTRDIRTILLSLMVGKLRNIKLMTTIVGPSVNICRQTETMHFWLKGHDECQQSKLYLELVRHLHAVYTMHHFVHGPFPSGETNNDDNLSRLDMQQIVGIICFNCLSWREGSSGRHTGRKSSYSIIRIYYTERDEKACCLPVDLWRFLSLLYFFSFVSFWKYWLWPRTDPKLRPTVETDMRVQPLLWKSFSADQSVRIQYVRYNEK